MLYSFPIARRQSPPPGIQTAFHHTGVGGRGRSPFIIRWFTVYLLNGDFLYGYVSHNRFTELKNGGSFYMANCECHNRLTVVNSMVDLSMANCECHNQRLLYPSQLVDSQATSPLPRVGRDFQVTRHGCCVRTELHFFWQDTSHHRASGCLKLGAGPSYVACRCSYQ